MEEPQARTVNRSPADVSRQGQAPPDERLKRPVWRRPAIILIGTALILPGLILGGRSIVEAFTHESTGDAFLDGDIVSLAPKVAGQVSKVLVADNQFVKQGALLAEIDSRDLELALEQKRAALASETANEAMLKSRVELGRRQIETAEATVKQNTAGVTGARAAAEKAAADLRRAEDLRRNQTISEQEYENARAASNVAAAALKAAEEKATSSQSKVNEALAQFEAQQKAFERAQALARQAESDVKAAELNLSYARITAPQDGFVTKKAVEAGDYVQVGQRLMALVPPQLFVTANFKETQLRQIRPGQRVRISVDSVESGPFRGHVDSIMAGSGARFSLLPPENAVGNYVKVVQRVPVKIVFDEPLPASRTIGPGMSVVPSIHVSNTEISPGTITVGAVVLGLLLGLAWWLLAKRTERNA